MMIAERIAQIEKGVAYGTFPALAQRLGVSEEQLRNVLNFSSSTLHRRKIVGRFNLDESNKLYWLESLLDMADHVLEDPQETKAFMTTGNLALNGASPLEYARTAPGMEAVRRLLLQLDHGIIV